MSVNTEILLRELRDSFGQAVSRQGTTNIELSIAGQPVRIEFADPGLQRILTPSLQGLLVREARPMPRPALTIRVWGGASAAFPCAPLQASLARYPDKISVLNLGSTHLQYNPEGKILSCIDTSAGEAYYYASDAADVPDYEICTPMRMLFNWHCAAHGALMVHAAAIGRGGIGALIIGKSGAGKSTTGLQCLLNGMEYLGDDYVAVSGQSPTIAHHLYRGCKVMDDALTRMPQLQPHVTLRNPASRKSVVILDEGIGSLVPTLQIAAIIRPRVCHAEASSFSRLGAMQAVTEFAGSTILQMPGTGSYMLRELSRLCADIPAYEMALSCSPQEIAGALGHFLDQFPQR